MEGNGQNESALPAKDLFRIGEVSRLTATKQFVLRYWESEFPMLQPVKSPKGHRLYRRQDIDTVLRALIGPRQKKGAPSDLPWRSTARRCSICVTRFAHS